jgi:hypothetical protein
LALMQTRMLCGPLGMSQPGPADHDTYLCALQNLLAQFEVKINNIYIYIYLLK